MAALLHTVLLVLVVGVIALALTVDITVAVQAMKSILKGVQS
jgi:hypothetical protein